MDNEELKKLMRFDSLSEAERIKGKSYKEDGSVGWLGMALMMENSEKKNAMLDAMGDTKLSNAVDDYLAVATSFGFEVILVEPFTSKSGIGENLYILWNDELGILLKFDTHTWGDDGSWEKAGKTVPPPGVNGGDFYYNINLKPASERDSGCLSSGSYHKIGDDYTNIYIGSHDCREGLKHKINTLKENGEFIPKWVERGHLWLLHYGDTEGKFDSEKINEERISKFPEHVIDAISPK